MKKNIRIAVMTAASALAAAPALAHPGHDHSSAFALMEHAVWAAPLAIGLVALVMLVKKQSRRKD
jgi:hypothetical protein